MSRYPVSDPLLVASIKGLVSGAVNSLRAPALGLRPSGAPVILAALLVGLVGYGLSLAFFVLALRHLGTARTGAYFSLAPFMGAAVAVLCLPSERGTGSSGV